MYVKEAHPVVLYRDGRGEMEKEELEQLKMSFPVARYRTEVSGGSLVIGRYSVLPFYKELETELGFSGSKLINSYEQHRYVADLQNWVQDLGDLTPRTWSRLEDLPEDGTSFILKGETNSKKFEWDTHMFAKDKRAAIEVHGRLCRDGLIGSQDIYIREFTPLHTYFIGVGGLPVTKEFRLFVAYEQLLCSAFYWTNHIDEVTERFGEPCIMDIDAGWLDKVIKAIGRKVNFYALDIGQLQNGSWTVIELNDGQMSGLSMNHPGELYASLREEIDREAANAQDLR